MSFVSTEPVSGLASCCCCQQESRAVSPRTSTVLSALQQHGVSRTSQQVLKC